MGLHNYEHIFILVTDNMGVIGMLMISSLILVCYSGLSIDLYYCQVLNIGVLSISWARNPAFADSCAFSILHIHKILENFCDHMATENR